VTLIWRRADGLSRPGRQHPRDTTTGADGFYQFAGLTPGVEYQSSSASRRATPSPARTWAATTPRTRRGPAGLSQVVTAASARTTRPSTPACYSSVAAGVDIEKLVHGSYEVPIPRRRTEASPRVSGKPTRAMALPRQFRCLGRHRYSPDDKVNAIFGTNLAGNPSCIRHSHRCVGLDALMRQRLSAC